MPSFKDWYDLYKTLNRLSDDPYDLRHQYDYEAAYEAGAVLGPKGHFPSKFKGIGHPTRFLRGVDTATGKKGKTEDIIKNIQIRLLIEELHRGRK